MLPCPTEITWPPEIEMESLLNTVFNSGHGGGRGAGAGLGAVPRQVRAGARVWVSGGRETEAGAGQEGRPSLDCNIFIVQLPIKIFSTNKNMFTILNSFTQCEIHSHSTHILRCSPVSCDFYLTSNLLWVRSKNLTWAMALLMLLTHIFGPGHRYT